MDGFISATEEGFGLANQAGACAALVAAAVLAINVLLRRRLTAGQMCVLWGLVLLRLVIPSAPESSWSLQNLFQSPEREVAKCVVEPPPVSVSPVVLAPAKAAGEATTLHEFMSGKPVEAEQSPWEETLTSAIERVFESLPIVWLAGAVFVVAGTAGMHWGFCRRVNRAARCRDNLLLALWDECCELAGVHGQTSVVLFEGVQQPAIMGVFYPTLLLPLDAGCWKREQLRMVMLHELAQVRRWDVAANWALVLVRAVQWWNPIYWLAASRYRSLREQACDAFVIDRLEGRPASAYGELLLELAQRPAYASRWRVVVPASILGMISSTFRNRSIRSRLDALRNSGLLRRKFGVAAIAIMLIVAVTGLTDAVARPVPPRPQRLEPWRWAGPTSSLWKGDHAEQSILYEGPTESRTYDVAEALKRVMDDPSVAPSVRRFVFVKTLELIFPTSVIAREPSLGATSGPSESKSDASEIFQIDGETLTVRAPAELHGVLAHTLKAWAENGLSQFSVATRFISAERDLAAELGISWKYMEAFAIEQPAAAVKRRDDGMPVVRAAASVDEYRPIVVTTLSEAEESRFIDASQGNRLINIIQAPRVTLFNGQRGVIVDCAQIPFVVGVNAVIGELATAAQPKIVVLDEGSRIGLRATEGSDAKSTCLEASIQFSSVDDVAQATAIFHGSPVTIQTPRVKRVGFDVDCEVEEGESLLVGCLPAFEQEGYFYTLISVQNLGVEVE